MEVLPSPFHILKTERSLLILIPPIQSYNYCKNRRTADYNLYVYQSLDEGPQEDMAQSNVDSSPVPLSEVLKWRDLTSPDCVSGFLIFRVKKGRGMSVTSRKCLQTSKLEVVTGGPSTTRIPYHREPILRFPLTCCTPPFLGYPS